MSFLSTIVHVIITYTLYTPWTGIQKDLWNFYTRFSSQPSCMTSAITFRIVNVPYICSNIPGSSIYGVNISQLIRYAKPCSSYCEFINTRRLLTKKLVDQGHHDAWNFKIYFRKIYSRYNDLLQHYNTPLSHFMCDLVPCWCALYTPDMTGYTLDSTAVTWLQQVTLTRAFINTLGFSRVSVLSWMWHLFQALLFLWTNHGFRFTEGGRLFLLYFKV